MEDSEVVFTDDALKAIAHKAAEKGTGARGLRSIVESAMLDVMYELPDQPKNSRFVIDEKVINGESLFKMPETKSA